ncbi:hypothetical protein FACS189499_09670 [Clostridia bacterium]|nr:hypothetical protein FACS189499_09670 [Clostridia bacterium]
MGYKIAAASSDGVNIDLHFGKADSFHIAEVADDGSFRFTEVRRRDIAAECSPEQKSGCSGGCKGGGGGKVNAALISDCAYLLVEQIGMHALQSLAEQGITAFDVSGSAEKAVKRIIDYNTRMEARKRH